MIPLQMIVWPTHDGRSWFVCGIMCQRLDDCDEEIESVFLLIDESAPRVPGPCEMCEIATTHIHPAIDHFAYDPAHETFTSSKTIGPPPNGRGWWARSMN